MDDTMKTLESVPYWKRWDVEPGGVSPNVDIIQSKELYALVEKIMELMENAKINKYAALFVPYLLDEEIIKSNTWSNMESTFRAYHFNWETGKHSATFDGEGKDS